MSAPSLTVPLPGHYTATRLSLHALAEHVLAAARHHATGRIGLRVVEGGIGTPPFGPDGRTLSVEGGEIVLRVGADVRRARVTTVRAAAELAGIEPGAPAEVFTPSTPLEPDAPLTFDPAAAALIAGWYALGDAALRAFMASTEHGVTEPVTESDITLWPEHLDVAIRAGEVNYGASPGDDGLPEPYLYVGPALSGPGAVDLAGDPFWNAPFGAVLTRGTIGDAVDPVGAAAGFFAAGRRNAG